jgi:ankyrin repeat protein
MQLQDDVHITPEVFVAAARNLSCGRDVVELFSIRQRPDLSFIDEYGRTALSWALLRGNRAILDLFSKVNGQFDYTAPVIFRDKLGCSMIHLAAMGNCIDLLDRLPDYNKNIHALDNQDWTALH